MQDASNSLLPLIEFSVYSRIATCTVILARYQRSLLVDGYLCGILLEVCTSEFSMHLKAHAMCGCSISIKILT